MNNIVKNISFVFTIFTSLVSAQQGKNIELRASNKEPFKYYQLNASTVEGLTGEIYLNDEKIHEFDDLMSSVSSNKAQDLIQDGTNTITLKVFSISEDAKEDYFTKHYVHIELHGVNEKVFPTDDNRILEIKWSPKEQQNKEAITYSFELER